MSVTKSISLLPSLPPSSLPPSSLFQVKDKEAELKNAEQKLHDEFERLRRRNTEEKRELEDQKRVLVSAQNHTCNNDDAVFYSVQDEDTKVFNQKKAALQAQRAQSEQNQLRTSGKKR